MLCEINKKCFINVSLKKYQWIFLKEEITKSIGNNLIYLDSRRDCYSIYWYYLTLFFWLKSFWRYGCFLIHLSTNTFISLKSSYFAFYWLDLELCLTSILRFSGLFSTTHIMSFLLSVNNWVCINAAALTICSVDF